MSNNPDSKPNQTKLKGQATPKQIEEWKTDLNNGEELVTVVNEGCIAYFKKPGRTEIGQGMTLGAGNSLEVQIKTWEACFIGGDNSIFSDDMACISAGIDFYAEHVKFKNIQLGKC